MFERRLKVFLGILSAVVILLLGRAAQLQVAQAEDWRKAANDTLKKTSHIETSRGSILDRNGRPLAGERACSDACVIYPALTQKADPEWLTKLAILHVQTRLGENYKKTPKAERKKLIQQEMDSIQADIDAMWEKLARVAGKPIEDIQSARQAVVQRVEMRKKYIWYQSFLRAMKTSGGASDVEPRWQRWLSGQSDDAPEIDKFEIDVGEERQYHVILHDISQDVQNELRRHPEQFPGLEVRAGHTRYYPLKNVACHILGRIGKVNREDLVNDPNKLDPRRKYFPNDEIGRTGLESLAEPALRGVQGTVVKIDGQTTTEPPQPGQDIRTTIDVEVQKDIQDFFADATLRLKKFSPERGNYIEEIPHQVLHGAAVLLDVKTNQVIALVSYPTYDLNTQDEKWQTLSDDQIDSPLRNRATESQLEPGSTVKPLVGLSGITAGVVKVNEGIECKGYLELPDRRSGKMLHFGRTGRCWVASTYAQLLNGDVAHHKVPPQAPHHGHDGNQDGFLTYSDGLERSCNVYFETVADRLGIEALSDWMMRFGLGRKTGIGIHEFKGLVPVKADIPGQRRTIGFLGGIGQMGVWATPIQMADVASTIARGGIWMRPHLVMPDPKTGKEAPLKYEPDMIDGPDVVDLHLDPEAVKACKLGMYNVVNSPGGTGTSARMDDLVVAGKTGTAQAAPFKFPLRDPITHKVLRDENHNVMYQTFEASTPDKPNPVVPWYRGSTNASEKPIIDHSWMIGFAPANDPKIAYAVLVEYGGSGGGAAADVVRTALESCIKHGYLQRQVKPPATQPVAE